MELLNVRGVLRLWRDVIGHRTTGGEYLVISSEAGIKGDEHTLFSADTAQPPIVVRVLDSRPTIFQGSVRHELRLAPLAGATAGNTDVEGQ